MGTIESDETSASIQSWASLDSETSALIDGKAVDADDSIEVRSPFDGSLLSTVPLCGTEHVDRAVSVARERLTGEQLPAYERAAILDRVAAALFDRSEEFARSISAEAAKPITAARTETMRAVDTVRFSAAVARTLAGEMIAMDSSEGGFGRVGFTLRVPIGVVGCISPFNFPLNLVCHKVAPGVAAGVPMVLKPASSTPLSALKLAHLFEECGLPPGWLNVVTAPGSVGQHLVEHADVAMITFTGSPEVGWAMREAAPRKRIGLELGNSSPVIVESDADLGLAAQRIVAGGFGYSGQTCISVQRVYAHSDIYQDLADRVAEETAKVVVGDPRDDSTVVTSLIDERGCDKVTSQIVDALDKGATELTSHHAPSHQPSGGGTEALNLVHPTLLADVTMEMSVSTDEIFGPVIGLSRYDRIDDAIAQANGTRYGLQAGIFTSSLATALEAAQRLTFGGVIINDTSSYRTDQQPYGGVKDSGNTREGPAYAVEEMTELRTVIMRG